jgi:hypothetical protein
MTRVSTILCAGDQHGSEAASIERMRPHLHGVHGTAALDPAGSLIMAARDGEIDDHPRAERGELTRLRYSRIEAEHRLRLHDEFGDHERALPFATRPDHKRHRPSGSDAVAELIDKYRPRLAVRAGPPTGDRLCKSRVVAPGSLSDGHCAFMDLQPPSIKCAGPGSVSR